MNDYRAYPIPTGAASYGGTQAVYEAKTAYNDRESPVVEQPRFEATADRLASLPDNLAKAVHRLRSLADRYGGSVPEPVGKGEAGGPPSCLAARLEMTTASFESLLGALHSQIDRLERF